MPFLHGVEIIEIESGVKPITQARSGVIGLIGIAPKGTPQTLTLIPNKRAGETTFGKPLPGFTIPQALGAIFDQGAGLVMVLNIFDPVENTAEVDAETKTITDGKAKTTYAPINGTIELTNSAGTTTYTAGDEYTVDEYGNIKVLDFSAIAEGASVKATYLRLDSTTIAAADVVGANVDGDRTGLECFDVAQESFGFVPRILISPTYCQLSAVATALEAKANALKAVTIIDAPVAQIPADILTARGPGGTVPGFQSSSKRVILTYPHVKKYDVATDATVNYPLSPYVAGVMSATDNNSGFWFSPSNKVLLGVSGAELPLSGNLNDTSSELNLLNAAGVMTVFSAFGTGLRLWGNRSAAYPAASTPDVFISVQRVKDIINDSVLVSSLAFVDQPITLSLIDAIKASVNAYLRSLVQRGALVDGVCLYNPDDNPVEQIAAGQLVFEIQFMPPTPAERITFNSLIDINLLQLLNQE